MPNDDPNMNDDQNKGFIRRFLDAPPDSVGKTIFVAVSLCLVASLVVSAAAVSLRPTQEVNELRNLRVNVLQVAGVYDPEVPVEEAFAAFDAQVLDIAAGTFTAWLHPGQLVRRIDIRGKPSVGFLRSYARQSVVAPQTRR